MQIELSKDWWQFLVMAVVSYLIGCLNFAVIISKIRKKDITKMGSGNPGAMNMSREFGMGIGVLTFVFDALKCILPTVAVHLIYKDAVFVGTSVCVSDVARYFCGLFVVVGHIFPVTMRFKGGKGISATMGMFWAALTCETWWFFFMGFVVAAFVLGFIKITKWGGMGSMLGVTGCSIWQALIFYFRYEQTPFNVYLGAMLIILLLINILTWAAHHQNIMRMLSGEEHHTGDKKKKEK